MKFVTGLVLLFLTLSSCTIEEKNYSMTKQRPISEVLREHSAEWMKIPGVIGTGEGAIDDKPAVIVMVNKSTNEIKLRIPKEVDGYPVQIDEVGTVRALDR
jgi:hypothetical protein